MCLAQDQQSWHSSSGLLTPGPGHGLMTFVSITCHNQSDLSFFPLEGALEQTSGPWKHWDLFERSLLVENWSSFFQFIWVLPSICTSQIDFKKIHNSGYKLIVTYFFQVNESDKVKALRDIHVILLDPYFVVKCNVALWSEMHNGVGQPAYHVLAKWMEKDPASLFEK